MNATQLYDWLTAQGFRLGVDHLARVHNMVHWYAWRRSKLDARRCECNNEKEGISIGVWPSQINDPRASLNVTVKLTGEYAGRSHNLECYSLTADELVADLDSIEASLIAAWNALKTE